MAVQQLLAKTSAYELLFMFSSLHLASFNLHPFANKTADDEGKTESLINAIILSREMCTIKGGWRIFQLRSSAASPTVSFVCIYIHLTSALSRAHFPPGTKSVIELEFYSICSQLLGVCQSENCLNIVGRLCENCLMMLVSSRCNGANESLSIHSGMFISGKKGPQAINLCVN